MTGSAAAFLATELLGAVSDFAAVLGLRSTLTLVVEVLDDVEIDGVVVRLDAEYALVKDDLLSGFRSVNLQN